LESAEAVFRRKSSKKLEAFSGNQNFIVFSKVVLYTGGIRYLGWIAPPLKSNQLTHVFCSDCSGGFVIEQ
jgi:hypothetical protein